MAEKRNRPSDNPPELPPGRNLGVGNSSCGGHADADSDPLSKIVAAGARKERLRERDWASVVPTKESKSKSNPAPRPRYAELRCASAFSFLDGASLPEDLVEEAARLEIPAVALVDANGVYGAPRFYKAAKAAGIKALVGAEVTLCPEGALSSRGAQRRGIPESTRRDVTLSDGLSGIVVGAALAAAPSKVADAADAPSRGGGVLPTTEGRPSAVGGAGSAGAYPRPYDDLAPARGRVFDNILVNANIFF